jgi:Zn-dependent M28 family amino/carboxypeptidase
LISFLFFLVGAVVPVVTLMMMPGKSYRGPLPPLTEGEKGLQQRLYAHVDELSAKIGERNIRRPENLKKAEDYIVEQFKALGYEVGMQEFDVSGQNVANVEAVLTGTRQPEQIFVLGAHYDSVESPAANDNASGVAALIELVRLLKESQPEQTIRFVAFVNEEPPFFLTPSMGSFVYAKRCRERGESITGMFSLETIGYYSDDPGSQRYPFPLNYVYPDTGNFIGFVGNVGSRSFVRQAVRLFREMVQFPSEGGAVPEFFEGVGWSDHASFWKFGYPALMITDTAPYRYPYYHTQEDTIDKLDFERMSRVVQGLQKVVEAITTDRPN